MKQEAEANADTDKKAKEEAETLNQADGLIFQIEKTMKDLEDKLTEEQKTKINEDLENLKKAHSEKNIENVKTNMDSLNLTFQNITQEIYSQGQTMNEEGGTQDVEVNDVDFDEVKSN